MKRHFFVIHSHGAEQVLAASAAEAVRCAFIPAGLRDAFGVVDAELIIRGENSGGPFTAIVEAGAAAVGGRETKGNG